MLAKRLSDVSESATLKLNALVQSMKAQGVNVVNLTAGEPDFHVPDAAKQAVIQALQANLSKYTPVPGVAELRTLVAEKTNLQQPSVAALEPWKPENVVISNGGKQAIFNFMLALLNPGDEVLIPAPYWLSYPEMTKVAEGKPMIVQTTLESRFKLSPELLRTALKANPRIRAVIFNSPSNPTGSMYSKEEFAKLGDVLLSEPSAKNVWVLSDEIYDQIAFEKYPFCSFLEAVPKLKDRTVTVNGLSKSAAMTGWRIGWSVAPKSITQAMSTLQGQSTSGISSLTQAAGIAALKLPPSYYQSNQQTYRRRRDLALEILHKAGKIKVMTPEGAFYVFLGVEAYLGPGEDSASFAEKLLQSAKVAVVSGTPFGAPNFVRLSFATDEKSLQEGCERIVQYLNSLG